ncbi:SDR family oxidoreductase [Paenibacillus cellulositrophicus]|uniref:SDR family oxidoreductase n=1 Tax=Paenibacillus cellulositrophicus TaxID=562959 RepID=UPI003D964D76
MNNTVRFNNSRTFEGKYIVITGATSGIGYAAAKALVLRGAKLGIVARSRGKAAELSAELGKMTNGEAQIDCFIADMSSQQDIRRAAAEILNRVPRIDRLINNAGTMFVKKKLSEDGLEMTWAVNHLGPFLLTSLLLDRLKASGDARIITTSSHGHKMAKRGIDFTDMNGDRLYSGPKALLGGANLRYGQSKLANILFTAELARRLKGTGVTAHCFDPGLVATNFNQDNGGLARLTMACMKPFSRTPEQGAQTLVWLAESPELLLKSGGYYADMKLQTPSDAARDEAGASRLWQVSEEQTGLLAGPGLRRIQ